MANTKSAIKRARQTKRRTERSRAVRSAARAWIKKGRAAIERGDKEEAGKLLSISDKVLSKAAQKGIIHHRAASRRISRLAKAVAKLDRADAE